MNNLTRLLTSIFVICLATAAWSDNSNGWETAIDEEGIQVWLRDVPGKAIKEFRGTVTLATSVERLVALYLNPEQCTAWVPDCHSSYLETLSEDEFILYRQLNTPWPVKNREYALRVNRTTDSHTGEVTMTFEDIGDAIANQGCCIRMERYKGFKRFTPNGNDTVTVTFQNHFHPGGNFPSRMINSSLPGWPQESLTRMRELLEATH